MEFFHVFYVYHEERESLSSTQPSPAGQEKSKPTAIVVSYIFGSFASLLSHKNIHQN
jgi:hypothetical protein